MLLKKKGMAPISKEEYKNVFTFPVSEYYKRVGIISNDSEFDEVAHKCSFIAPVPSGVGPMTICSLMKNTLSVGKKELYD